MLFFNVRVTVQPIIIRWVDQKGQLRSASMLANMRIPWAKRGGVVPPPDSEAQPRIEQKNSVYPKEKMSQYTPITKYARYIAGVGPLKQHH